MSSCNKSENVRLTTYDLIGMYIPRLRIDVAFNFALEAGTYSPVPASSFA